MSDKKPVPETILTDKAKMALESIEDAVNAFSWYAEELIMEISEANDKKFQVSDVHIVLLYQQMDSLNRVVKGSRRTLGIPKEE